MRGFFKFFFTIFLSIFSFCASSQSNTLFTKILESQSGIHFNNKIKDDKEKNILIYSNFYGGAGVGISDFNNDGLKDVFFAGNIVNDKLYLNKGNLTFEDISNKAGIINDGGWSTGVTIADINNDGFNDIYISRELYDNQPELRRNLLYINNGDLTFTESSAQYGIDNKQRTRHATFFDYNKDGFLDLFLLTQPPNPGSYSEFFGTTLLKPEYHLVLYKNEGNGKFIEVTEKAGVNLTGFPNAVSASDFNNDGWTDLYVANDFYAPDFLFINNKDGTFTNIANQALNHMSYYSMGVDASDIDNDGFMDAFVVDMVAEDNFRLKSNMSGMNPKAFWKVVNDGGHYQYMYNNFHLNNGNNTFSDIAQIAGMAATDWSWANLIADFDNDGEKDVYITNGLLRDIRNTDADKKVGRHIIGVANDWVKNNPKGGDISIWDILDLEETLDLIPSQPIKNYAYKNLGNLNFEEISKDWGLDDDSFSNGAAYADLDNDGDIDIVVNNVNATAFIYRNNSKNNNFLRVHLKSNKNKPVFASRVEISAKGRKQYFETTNVRGIYSTSENIAHFGLGNVNLVDTLKVTWPNGKITIKTNLNVNQEIALYLEDATERILNKKKTNQLLFKKNKNEVLIHKHEENIFDDYDYQVLLPHKLSQFGPALAVADINNDGYDDVFIGGAYNKEATLYLYENDTFIKSNEDLWKNEKGYEDVDALFIDINNDGFLDLYVVSGGNEFQKNDTAYSDRVYINDGQGFFKKEIIINLPNISGSIVKAYDYDKDGDLDLFVGGRLSPRDYPRSASSVLLKNDNGVLVNQTDNIANELNDIGMVTDAIWSDFDNDGWTDLILVGEWMPITIFKNTNGLLQKQQIEDIEATKGWWFSIEQGDFDNDGDMDYIAGNLGLNYKYKTSTENPFDVYYHDFDDNGNLDIVLGYYQENKHYPLRGFSCSSQQIPSLKSNFKEYDVFASLELEDVYGKKNLKKALHLKADTFASLYLENKGQGKFKLTNLPNMAQTSNINDLLIDDFNEDGNLDVLGVGNLFVSEIETPRNDAGTGLLLLGDSKGNFEVIRQNKSGFFTNKDAKKVKTLNWRDKKMILIANNNDDIEVFELLNQN